MENLPFDPAAYEVKTCTLENNTIEYRAFEGLSYCTRPEDPIQVLNLFAPEAFYRGESINGYDLHTAPIFVLNQVGGYMPGPAGVPGPNRNGRGINIIFKCLAHGYVVAAVGVRGRTSGTKSNEIFEGGAIRKEEAVSDHFTGKAPALIVDMKAAIRFLRFHQGRIPGDTEKMVTDGISAGGALSALVGATGNSPDYEPYLKAIGALEGRDDIFAASCYCPIHNLEHADMAYEWEFCGIWDFHRTKHVIQDGQDVKVPFVGELTEAERENSKALKALFPDYVNSLGLKAPDGMLLTMEPDGTGSFQDYVISLLVASAQHEVETRQSRQGGMAERAIDAVPEELDCLTVEDGKVTGVDWEGYLRFITRMKNVPAFDALDLSSPENGEFGTAAIPARHFTAFAMERSTAEGAQMAEVQVVKMLNPVEYIGKADTARHWRVRHGAADRDTSMAIPTILALMLRNRGFDVDFRIPWAMPHSGDYDLPELFAWVDSLVK